MYVLAFGLQIHLFPAQAGVILALVYVPLAVFSVPRASGGDPNAAVNLIMLLGCSPRKRG